MDDPNISMEEYIRLEEEKAQRYDRTFNWQTATYGKVKYCKDENDCFTNIETKFPAIVFDDTLTSDATLSFEPTVSTLNENEIYFRISCDKSDDEDYMVIFDNNSFSYKIISVDNLKTDSENDNDKLDMPSFPSPGLTKDFENEFPTIVYDDALTSKLDFLTEPTSDKDNDDDEIQSSGVMAPLPPRDQRHPWLRSVNRVHVLDFVGLTKGMRQTLAGRLRMVYIRDEGQELFTSYAWRRLFKIMGPLDREFILEFLSTCRISDTEMGLDVVDTLCFHLGGARRRMTWRQFITVLGLHTAEEMAKDGFQAYWLGSERVIPDKGDLRDYWIEISPDMDFLCIDRGTANVPYLLAQYLSRYAKGSKNGARLSVGYFIGRLTAYFGLVSDEGLRGLSVITRELPMIDLHELVRLNIYERLGDMWAWVSPGSERQPGVVAGTPEAARDAPAVDEGAPADPAPMPAPQLPHAAPKTMP
ncbi:hypothetical protein Tco_1319904 [Tanacetum coccineum]